MAASRLIVVTPVAFMFGDTRLGMDRREAYAYSNIEASFGTDDDRAVMQAWLVKMILLHGTWVTDDLGFLNW